MQRSGRRAFLRRSVGWDRGQEAGGMQARWILCARNLVIITQRCERRGLPSEVPAYLYEEVVRDFPVVR